MAREISDKQLAANRRNAKRSIKSGDACGPRTPEGKERARFNALKPCPGLRSGNGLLARSVVVPTRDGPENRKQFERLLTQLRDKLNPDGILEEMLVEKIAVAYWRLRRALRAEAGEINDNLCYARDYQIQTHPGTLALPSRGDTLKIVRYETAIERQLHRAIDQLRSLQKDRRSLNPLPPEEPPGDEN